MLKHPELTSRRIKQFLDFELLERIYSASAELSIEFSDTPYLTASEARKGTDWEVASAGHRYGPAYKTFWFRLSGRVPKSFAGQEVGLLADVGGERTLWRSDSPCQGIDEPHEYCPLIASAKGGEKILLYVQSYSRNPQHRVHRRELPREPLVEEVRGAKLVVLNRELLNLAYDFEFAYDLMKALPEDDSVGQSLLRALNDVCNAFSHNGENIGRCRRILRDCLAGADADSKHQITPVGHAHLDTAWLWPIEITKKKMAHTTATQLRLMERFPEYVFVHSQASQYEWLEKEYPDLFSRVKEAIKRGQWEPVGSMWVEADCNLTGPESLVRQFLYGRAYFRDKLGYQTEDMWLPDVFGYSAALPQILSKFSIGYFLTQKISWNQINRFPHNTFWWQGIDGSKIWTHFPPSDTYCGDATPKELLKSVASHRDHTRSDQSLYVYGFGDGGGGPTEKHIEFLRRARSSSRLPEIQKGQKALDFFRSAKASSKDLQTWVGELYAEFHRGTYTSQAANKRQNRLCEFLLRDAEWLSCFRDDFPGSYPSRQLEEAWKLVLLNQFHDIIPGSSVHEVYVDSARDYDRVRSITGRLISDALKNIGSKFDTDGMRHPIVLFQNANVPSVAEISWDAEETPTGLEIADEVHPLQRTEVFGESKLLFCTPESALGAVVLGHLSEQPPTFKHRLKVSSRRLENDFLSVRFDGNGNITSLVLLEDGTEFVPPGATANVFQLLDDKPLFWSAWDVDAFAFETAKSLLRCESFEVVERGPVRVAVEVTRSFGNSRIRQRISLGPTPLIHFETEVDWHEEDKMLKVAFPVNVNSSRANYEIQFGNVERPTHYNTSWDIARFEVCAQKWADLSETDHGVAILNNGKYGHDIHDNVMRLSLLRAPKAPDPECDMGLHRFTYCLMPHFWQYQFAGVVQHAYALNAPVRYEFLEGQSGEKGLLPPFISCDDRNIVVEAVKKAETSSGLVVRMYECHNARGKAELFCARPVRSAVLCDLEERPLADLEVRDSAVLFSYRPFEILTILLRT